MATPANRRSGHSRRAQYSAFVGYILAVAGIIVAGIVLIFSTGSTSAFSGMRSAASDVTAPAAATASGGRTASRSLVDTIAGYFTKGRDVALLRREVAEARVKLAESAAVAEENRRLKDLLTLTETDPKPVTTARLIASTSTSTRRFATLSVGSRQGTAIGMPVRSPLGLVGRVLEVGLVSSRVLLITDGESVVPVRRAADGLPAFAEGHADGTLRIRLINLGVNPLKRGDAFVTSGSGGLYRPGIAIAVVIRLLPDGAIARPLSDPGSTEFVAVEPVWTPTTTDPTPSSAPAPDPSPERKP
jgi:rod shape-determining protein MreC